MCGVGKTGEERPMKQKKQNIVFITNTIYLRGGDLLPKNEKERVGKGAE